MIELHGEWNEIQHIGYNEIYLPYTEVNRFSNEIYRNIGVRLFTVVALLDTNAVIHECHFEFTVFLFM